ncbi:hypothetical protein Btru_062921 [Bulinus truncatus]|nr:hypothetical protein Btru_062921 [Bulinus truncatus]
MSKVTDFEMCDFGPYNRDPLVSTHDLFIIKQVFNGWLCIVIVITGLVMGVMNILIFRRLGWKDSVGVTMTGIAICDIIKLTLALVYLVYWPILLVSTPEAFSWENCMFPQMVFIHLIFTNVAYVMAGYLAIERCLCLAIPFRVKRLLTPRVTVIVLVGILIVVVTSMSPILFIYECYKTYSFIYKQEISCYKHTDFYSNGGQTYMKIYSALNICYPLASTVCMVTSAIAISRILHRARVRRAANCGGHYPMNDRDRRVTRMLKVSVIVFIFCILPRLGHFLARFIVKDYYNLEKERSLYRVVVYTMYFLDYANSCSHMPIMYIMSTNYRKCFKEIFFCCKSVTPHLTGPGQVNHNELLENTQLTVRPSVPPESTLENVQPSVPPENTLENVQPSVPPENTLENVQPSVPPENTMEKVQPSVPPENTMEKVQPSVPPENTMEKVQPSVPPDNTLEKVQPCVPPEDTLEKVQPSVPPENTMEKVQPECTARKHPGEGPAECVPPENTHGEGPGTARKHRRRLASVPPENTLKKVQPSVPPENTLEKVQPSVPPENTPEKVQPSVPPENTMEKVQPSVPPENTMEKVQPSVPPENTMEKVPDGIDTMEEAE